jgi:site-specific recombinase XerD
MKTGKSKDFPLGENAQKALREYLDTRNDIEQLGDLLFPSRKGGGKKSLQRAQTWQINDTARAVGLKENIGKHTLRKTFAYHAYQMGKDITLLQQLLNHHSPATTLQYIGITQDDLNSVYLTINR